VKAVAVFCCAVVGLLAQLEFSNAGAPAMVVPGQFNVTGSGAFTYTIPIVVPPGTAGMVPSLSLGYSNQSTTNGLEGWGWNLSGLPSITRCPRTLAQDSVHGSVNFDSYDRFCLEGQRLILVGGTYGVAGSEYRTEVEGFSKIIAYGTAGSGPQYFKVWTKSGQIMEFGNTTDSRSLAVRVTDIGYTCVGTYISDTECAVPLAGTVRSWAVNRISDTVGNYVDVVYNSGTPDTANGQVYPTLIKYTGNTNTSLTPYNSIQFVYNDRQFNSNPIYVPNYQAGSVNQSTKLLTEIKTCTTISTSTCTTSGGHLVSDYKLAYAPLSSATDVFELTSVTLCDGSATQVCLVPTTFDWQGGGVAGPTGNPITSSLGQGYWDKANLVPADYNGDGLIDLTVLFSNTQVCSWWNTTKGVQSLYLGDGSGSNFTRPSPDWVANYGADGDTYSCNAAPPTFYGGFTKTADWDGDGISDVLEADQSDFSSGQPTYWNVLRNNGSTGLTIAGDAVGVGHIFFGHWAVTGDFDGDGRTDVYSPTGDKIYFSLGLDGSGNWLSSVVSGIGLSTSSTGWFTADFAGNGCVDIMSQGVDPRDIAFQCNNIVHVLPIKELIANQWTVTFADFNGDGKTDIFISKHNNDAYLYYSVGTGFILGQHFAQSAGWNFSSHVTAADFNGDGKADIAVVPCESSCSSYSLYVYLSTGTVAGTSSDWSTTAAYFKTGLVSPANNPSIATSDYNGDGGPDLWVQFLPDSGNVNRSDVYLFTYTPISIQAVHNGLGATTTVIYDRINNPAATGLYTKGTGAQWPTQDVTGPMYVVKEVDSSTARTDTSIYKSTYTYAGAKMNLTGRGFEGFTTVAVTDPQTGIVQTTTYGTDFPLTGLVLTQQKECAIVSAGHCNTDVITNTTTNQYLVRTLQPTTAKRYFVELQSSTVTGKDLDGTAMPSVTTTYTYDCDSADLNTLNTCFGDPTTILVDTTDTSGVHSTKTTANQYLEDSADWLLGRLFTASVESVVASSDLTRHTSYCYDLPGSGAGYCRDATRTTPGGLLMEEVVEPGASDASLTLTTDYTYDTYGNKTQVKVSGCTYLPPSFTCTSTSHTTTTTFDNKAQFAVTVKNNLNETETWGTVSAPGYDARFGLPTLHTGPNALATKWVYDGFGRVIEEDDPSNYLDSGGSLVTAWTKVYTSYGYCSGTGGGTDTTCTDSYSPIATVFAVNTVSKGTDSTSSTTGTQIAPNGRTYYDMLSRAAYADVQGFNGCWIRSETQYDVRGRIGQTSRPFFLGGGTCSAQTPVWTVNSYITSGSRQDAFGRVCKETRPDGGYTTFAYHGLQKTVTEYLAASATTQTATTTKNAQGLIWTIKDAKNYTTTYTYDAFDNLTDTVDQNTNDIHNTYDLRGRKTASADPDMGSWSYAYDSFGELYKQTDAKSQITTMTYDGLGRLTGRTETDMVSTWAYGTTSNQGTNPNSIDKLITETCAAGASGNACGTGSITKTHYYDVSGRQYELQVATGSLTPVYSQTSFDPISGKPTSVRSFSGFVVVNLYNAYGYQCQIVDSASDMHTGCTASQDYWTVATRDAELHALQQVLTGATPVVVNSVYDPNSGRIESICGQDSSGGCDLANYTYGFDSNGNLLNRTDLLATNVSEAFCYDALNRLTNYAIGDSTSTCTSGNGTGGVTKTVAYDAIGNITSKSDVSTTGGYHYGGAGPHAVSSISSCTPSPHCFLDVITSPNYYYDANGNMLCVTAAGQCGPTAARSFGYTSFNMTASIAPGTHPAIVTLGYGPDHQRISQSAPEGTTLYFNDPASGVTSEYFIATGSSTPTWRTYLMADGHLVGLRSVTGSSARYDAYITDHLGSVAVIANNGVVPSWGHLSYDPWGKSRNSNGTDDTSCTSFPTQSTTMGDRGFTGHEEMTSVCLVNANARIYNPTIGRFLSADPTVQEPLNPQDLNRYSYVHNNPLSFTDPSGLGSKGGFFRSALFRELAATAVAFLLDGVLLPELEAGISVFSVGGLTGGSTALTTGQLALNAGIAGGASGAISTGTAKGALMGGLEAEAFFGVGQGLGDAKTGLTLFGSHTAAVFVAHGAVGGLFSIGQKGGFVSGFLAAGMASLADEIHSGPAGDLVIHAVAGGVGSMLGGGKFGNGAATGAFGYLFNLASHPQYVDIGGHNVPISLLEQLQQDIANVSVAGPQNYPPEYSGWLTDNAGTIAYTPPVEGSLAQAAVMDVPLGAFAQYHSHPPENGWSINDITNTVQDYASSGRYMDIQRWTNTQGKFDFLAHGITGAIVFGPTAAYYYDLRSLTSTTNPSSGVPILSGSQVSWPRHTGP